MLDKKNNARMHFDRFIRLLPLAFELIYFGFASTAMPPLFMAIIAFPAMFIFPGVMLLAVLRKKICTDILQLVVEGFFISTVIMVMLTSILLAESLSLTSLAYSIVTLCFVSVLTTIGFARKIEIKPTKRDVWLLALAFTVYIVLISCFSTFPRLFTPDETSYIFSARMGILNGIMPPMPTSVFPDANVVKALLEGRCFWIYLLASFLGSTGLPAYQAGLIGVGFLIMTALTSSLIVKSKRLSIIVFAAVAINPLLFSFSILTLNDLAISFYAVFAVLFFVRSFSKAGDSMSLNIENLIYSLIAIIILTLLKPNLLVFVAMWIILIFTIVKYKLYKLNRKYKILTAAVLLPVLIYELCLDLPYVISMWILRSVPISGLFDKFLFISPIEQFSGWFLTPWWNPSAPTLFTHSFADYIDYFYRILSPEHSSLIISAIVLALPILNLSRGMRKELDRTVLTSLVLLSLCLFYFDAVASASLDDASRYSLWMIPLWVPLALMTLQDIIDSSSLRELFPVLAAALIFFSINIWLSIEKGGVFVGYLQNSPRIWTAEALMIQLISMIVIVSLLFVRRDLPKVRFVISKKLSATKTVNMKSIMFCLLVILILLNGVYFGSQFMENSWLYKNHGLTTINDALGNLTNKGSLVFANNYIYMRPCVSDWMFQQGLVLPPPDTEEEFFKLLEVAPNNTLFLISNDTATTWYEYANNYIKNYANNKTIASEEPNASVSALRIRDIPLPTGQASLFRVIDENVNTGQSITVKDSSISVNENRTVIVEVQIDSPKSENATILIATDRFTKVYVTPLNPGVNNVKYDFDYIVDPSWYEGGGLYWLHLAQARVIVIEGNGVVYNEFLTTQDTKSMNLLLLILLLVILIVYLAPRSKHNEQVGS